MGYVTYRAVVMTLRAQWGASRRWVRTGALSAALVTAVGVSAASPTGAAEGPTTTASASSSQAGTGPGDLLDGSFATGAGGRQWTAAAGDAAPSVRLTFSSPRRIASVQVLGPAEVPAPWSGAPEAAALHGRLHFSDGSSVAVSGIDGGGAGPTTVAFTPRQVTSVRLELRRTLPTAVLGLRELAVYDAGAVPPRWPHRTAGYATTPPAASCGASSPAVAARPSSGLALVCPAPGSVVGSRATVVVWAPPGTSVTARGWRLDKGTPGVGDVWWVAAARAGADGRAVLSVDMRILPKGPTALRISRTDGTGAPLHVQLINNAGRSVPVPVTAPAGMDLRYSDDFDAPLSATYSGAGATYAAIKPEPRGSSEFGMASFADPAKGVGNTSTIPGG